jgi:hypothetical protein
MSARGAASESRAQFALATLDVFSLVQSGWTGTIPARWRRIEIVGKQVHCPTSGEGAIQD